MQANAAMRVVEPQRQPQRCLSRRQKSANALPIGVEVVLCHGLGDTAEQFLPFADAFALPPAVTVSGLDGSFDLGAFLSDGNASLPPPRMLSYYPLEGFAEHPNLVVTDSQLKARVRDDMRKTLRQRRAAYPGLSFLLVGVGQGADLLFDLCAYTSTEEIAEEEQASVVACVAISPTVAAVRHTCAHYHASTAVAKNSQKKPLLIMTPQQDTTRTKSTKEIVENVFASSVRYHRMARPDAGVPNTKEDMTVMLSFMADQMAKEQTNALERMVQDGQLHRVAHVSSEP